MRQDHHIGRPGHERYPPLQHPKPGNQTDTPAAGLAVLHLPHSLICQTQPKAPLYHKNEIWYEPFQLSDHNFKYSN